MGCKKISILIENEINNHQIYVPVFYLIEINTLVAFWGQKSWKNVYSTASPPRMHANARCGLREKNLKNFGKSIFSSSYSESASKK